MLGIMSFYKKTYFFVRIEDILRLLDKYLKINNMKNSKKLVGFLGLLTIVLFTMSFGTRLETSNSQDEFAYVSNESSLYQVSDFNKCGEGKCGNDAKEKKEKKCGDGKMKEDKKGDKKCGDGKMKQGKKGDKKCGDGKMKEDKNGDKKCGEGKKAEKKDKNAKCGEGKCGKN